MTVNDIVNKTVSKEQVNVLVTLEDGTIEKINDYEISYDTDTAVPVVVIKCNMSEIQNDFLIDDNQTLSDVIKNTGIQITVNDSYTKDNVSKTQQVYIETETGKIIFPAKDENNHDVSINQIRELSININSDEGVDISTAVKTDYIKTLNGIVQCVDGSFFKIIQYKGDKIIVHDASVENVYVAAIGKRRIGNWSQEDGDGDYIAFEGQQLPTATPYSDEPSIYEALMLQFSNGLYASNMGGKYSALNDYAADNCYIKAQQGNTIKKGQHAVTLYVYCNNECMILDSLSINVRTTAKEKYGIITMGTTKASETAISLECDGYYPAEGASPKSIELPGYKLALIIPDIPNTNTVSSQTIYPDYIDLYEEGGFHIYISNNQVWTNGESQHVIMENFSNVPYRMVEQMLYATTFQYEVRYEWQGSKG